MNKKYYKNIILAFTGSLLLVGCSGKPKNNDLDLSGFIKPIQQPDQKIEKPSSSKEQSKEINPKLISLDKKEEIVSSVKYGKKDPFSPLGSESIKLISEFKLKGFISFRDEDYALVEFKNQEGVIDINSVGDINTKLLPPKAFVNKINPYEEIIKITIEDEEYTIIMSLH